jgi:hypothetical protein
MPTLSSPCLDRQAPAERTSNASVLTLMIERPSAMKAILSVGLALVVVAASLAVADADEACGPDLDSALQSEFPRVWTASGSSRLRSELLRYSGRQLDVARAAEKALASQEGKLQEMNPRRIVDEQLTVFDKSYLEQRNTREARLLGLKRKVDDALGKGVMLACSEQILNEAEWLVRYTALWSEIDSALGRLEKSLDDGGQSFAEEQSADGAWGACRTQWLFRLDSTADELERIYALDGENVRLPVPLTFMTAIDQPFRLVDRMVARQISNVAATGVYGREEIASLYESTSQLLYKPYLRRMLVNNGAGFIDERYVAAFTRYLDDMQDPATGFWGPVLNVDTAFLRLADLSMTYHVIAYRRGCVHDWPRIASTLFATEKLEYPFGWRFRGQYNAHNNYDVVRILKEGWTSITPDQRDIARRHLEAMVRWAEAEVSPDGLVRYDPEFYETVGSAWYFMVSFLDEIGYLRRTPPFWTDHAVAPVEGPRLCSAMARRLRDLSAEYELAKAAQEKLAVACQK